MSLSARTAGFSVRSLYLQSFPKEERFSFLFLKILACTKASRFLAYYDGESLAGISFTIEGERMVFLLYMAVSPSLQSHGYGTEILEYLKEQYKKPITLNAEPRDDDSENADERSRRFAFYEQNGFSDTGYVLQDTKMTYTVLSSAKKFAIEDYYGALLGLHPKGIGMPKIRKR